MTWKLPRPIKPLEKPLPQHTGLFWTVGKILTLLAPVAAVSLFALPTAFVTWLFLNAQPIHARGGYFSPLRRYHVNDLESLFSADWFLCIWVALVIFGLIWARGFLAFTLFFWNVVVWIILL